VLLARVEAERERLGKDRRKPLTRTAVIHRLLRLALDGRSEQQEILAMDASPPAPLEAQLSQQADELPDVMAATRERDRLELWGRCDRLFDQEGITPPEFVASLRELDAGLNLGALYAWYCRGELPDGGVGKRLLGMVRRWLDGR
jgi:hypothetical protein